jgi:hypothetical protein
MANKIIMKRSSVAAKVPLATDLDVGEIAVNLADAKLYTKNAGGTVIELGGGGGVSDGDKGDITVSSSGTVWTIDNGAVNLTTKVTGTLPVANGGTGITSLGTGVATFLGTPTSANLAAAVTNETGSGALVFATSPTLVTPALGTPSSATLTNATGLPIVAGTTGTLSVARGGTGATTLTANNVLLGNGTSAPLTVAPSTSGNVLTSNGTTWTSAAAPSPTIASTAEAGAGTNNTNFITPLRMREGFNASGTAPVYACRAWVNFNGTGTVAIRNSGNVSSLTDHGTGDYSINYTTAITSDNAPTVTSSNDAGTGAGICPETVTVSTTSFRVRTRRAGGALTDNSIITVHVFR